jgi:signal transduction histidine kinase
MVRRVGLAMLARMKDRVFGPLLARVDRHPDLTDAAIAAGFVGLGLASFQRVWPEQPPVSPAVAAALLVALVAPLAWRRRRPLAALAVYTVLIAVYALSGLPQNPMFDDGWLLAAYSAGAYGEGRWRTWVRAGSAAAFLVLDLVDTVTHGGLVTPGNPVLGFGLYVATTVVFVAWIWLFGDVARAAREREAELAVRTRQLGREREASARRDERVRIAREVHDVVAHHVSLMGVQAGAARRVLHRQPEQAEQALSAIEATSREAVRELHRLLVFFGRRRTPTGWTRSRACGGSMACSPRCARPGCRSRWRSKGRRGPCRPPSTCPPTASSKRR